MFSKRTKRKLKQRLCTGYVFFWGGGGGGEGGRLYSMDPISYKFLSMFWPSYIFFARHQHGTKTLAFPETHDMVGFDGCEGPMGPILV